MTILFLARLFHPHIGGVEKHILEISKRLIKKGHKIIIITEKFDSSLSNYEMINDIEVHRINPGANNWFKKFRIWKEMWRLRHLIIRADIVHCHDVFYWYLPFRFLYFTKPVYTIFHGYESYPILYKAIRSRKISELLSWGTICVGDFMKKWYDANPTFVSYGGTTIPSKKETSQNKTSAVFIGRLDEQTGILDYVKAAKIVKKTVPEFNVFVVGDGKYRKSIEKVFNVTGFQKNPEQYLPAYRFAFVSRYLAILEALAAKRLVFALYDNPVKEDYLRLAPFAKFIVIEQTPEKLAKKIEYYLKNPKEEEQLVEKGYQWVKKNTWEEVVSMYLKLWKLER